MRWPGQSARKQEIEAGQHGDNIDCVFLTSFDHDFRLFAGLLLFGRIRLHQAETVEQADFLLIATGAKVLLTDSVFLNGTWDDAAEMLRNVHPTVALVVVVEGGDDVTRNQATHRIGNLLTRPLRMGELRRMIHAAHQISLSCALG